MNEVLLIVDNDVSFQSLLPLRFISKIADNGNILYNRNGNQPFSSVCSCFSVQ